MGSSIGEVSVAITGDQSELEKSLQDAVAAAVAGGATIAEALASAAAPAAEALAEALKGVGDSAEGMGEKFEETEPAARKFSESAEELIARQQEFEQAAAAAASTLEELYQGYIKGEVSSEALALAQEELDKATEKAGQSTDNAAQSFHHLGESAHEASHGAHELLTEMLEFAGIALTLEALKEFVKESVEVYAHTERVTIALGNMSGSAEGASSEVEHLKDTALELAVPFESLLTGAQKMSAFGVSAEGAEQALRGAADAAAQTGFDFDSVVQKMTSISLSGMAAGRSLVTLGLNSQDLASVMGVSSEQVKKVFADASLTVEDRIAILTEAMERKFPDAAKKMAESTSGQLTNLQNSWTFTMDEIGKSFAGMTVTAIPALQNALKGLVFVFVITKTAVEEMAAAIAGTVNIVADTIVGLGKNLLALATGDIRGASRAVTETASTISSDWTGMVRGISESNAAMMKSYNDLWPSADPKKNGDPEAGTKGLADALNHLNEIAGRTDETFKALHRITLESAILTQEAKNLAATQSDIVKWMIDFRSGLYDADAAAAKLPADIKEFRESMLDAADGGKKLHDALSKVLAIHDPLEAAVKEFGATTVDQYKHMADVAEAAFELMRQSGMYSDEELTRSHLEAEEKRIEADRQAGYLTEAEYRDHINNIKGMLDELDGKNKDVHTKEAEYLKQIQSAVRSVGAAFGDLILDGGKFLAKMEDVGKGIVKVLVQDVVQYAFGKLIEAIAGAGTAIGKLGAQIAGVFGGAGSAVGSATSAAGSASGAAGSVVSGVSSGVSGVLGAAGAIGSVVSGITGIIGVFQSADLYAAMKAVALNTLGTANEVMNLRADSWAREDHLMAKLDDMWNEIRNVVSAIKDIGTFGVPTSPVYAGGSPTQPASGANGGTNIFHITEARNPRETARAVADVLRSLSPKFSPSTP